MTGEELGTDEKKSDKNDDDEACVWRLLEEIGAHVACDAQQLFGEGVAGQRDGAAVQRVQQRGDGDDTSNVKHCIAASESREVSFTATTRVTACDFDAVVPAASAAAAAAAAAASAAAAAVLMMLLPMMVLMKWLKSVPLHS